MAVQLMSVVHCYDGDKRLVEEFLPEFKHHGTPILVLSPEDRPVEIYDPDVIFASAGLAGWKGAHTIQRQLKHWAIAEAFGADWYLLNDSDSVCITPDLPEYLFYDDLKFWSNVLCHEHEHLPTDQPNFQPPYFCSRRMLRRLLAAAGNAGGVGEVEFREPHDWGNAIDGFYTYLVMNVLRLPYGDYGPDGATTWPPDQADLYRDARRGARLIHGDRKSV